MTDRPTATSRLEAARDVVYADGELIAPEAIDATLEAAGVTVTTDADDVTECRDVPPELPLSACHLAVDLREDPEVFLSAEA